MSFGIRPQNVMIFLNYPPSVYQLHFHVCAPFQRVLSYDAFRMHSLTSILSNLQMDTAYYQKVTFRMPVLLTSDFYGLLSGSCPENSVDATHATGPKHAKERQSKNIPASEPKPDACTGKSEDKAKKDVIVSGGAEYTE